MPFIFSRFEGIDIYGLNFEKFISIFPNPVYIAALVDFPFPLVTLKSFSSGYISNNPLSESIMSPSLRFFLFIHSSKGFGFMSLVSYRHLPSEPRSQPVAILIVLASFLASSILLATERLSRRVETSSALSASVAPFSPTNIFLVRSFSVSMTLCISSESVTTSSPPLRIRSTRLSLSSRSSAVNSVFSLRLSLTLRSMPSFDDSKIYLNRYYCQTAHLLS